MEKIENPPSGGGLPQSVQAGGLNFKKFTPFIFFLQANWPFLTACAPVFVALFLAVRGVLK